MLENDDLKFGELVQVKYEEKDDWIYAYFHMFWKDGRIQVIPNGQTPFTWTTCDGKQRHLLSDEDMKWGTDTFPHSTYNFYRKVQELTDSGDIGNSEAYLKHWGQKRISPD